MLAEKYTPNATTAKVSSGSRLAARLCHHRHPSKAALRP